MARILGIDLGSHAVKVAVFDGSFGRYQLTEYATEAVAQGVDAEPQLEDRLAALGQVLDRLGREGSRECSVGFPSEWASIRLVRLPFSDREQVDKTLPFELENLVPFELDEMVMAPRILGVTERGSTVLAALAAKDRVRPLLAGLKEIGADPKSLVLDADLLGDYAQGGVQAVVDFGHTRTLVALCRDGHVVGARAICLGGRTLTRALAQALELSWEDAEQAKHAATVSTEPGAAAAQVQWTSEGSSDGDDDVVLEWMDESDTQVDAAPTAQLPPVADLAPRFEVPPATEVLRRALKPLLVELRASLMALEDTYEVEIDEILVTGGGASLQGLRAWLGDLLGVPVRTAGISDDADLQHAPGRLALCQALGLKAARGAKGRALDLRRDEFAFRGDLATLGNLARYAAVAVAFFLLAGVGMFAWRYTQLRAELDGLDEKIRTAVLEHFPDVPPDKLDDASMALAIMQEKTLSTTGRVDRLGALVAEQPPMLGLLRDLSDSMPAPTQARIDVRELTVTTSSISIKADTDGYEAATKIETALQARSQFKGARKGDEKKSSDGVRFSITIPRGGEVADKG